MNASRFCFCCTFTTCDVILGVGLDPGTKSLITIPAVVVGEKPPKVVFICLDTGLGITIIYDPLFRARSSMQAFYKTYRGYNDAVRSLHSSILTLFEKWLLKPWLFRRQGCSILPSSMKIGIRHSKDPKKPKSTM